MKDKESNLGWRIIIECSDIKQKAKLLKKLMKHRKVVQQTRRRFKNFHLAIVTILEK